MTIILIVAGTESRKRRSCSSCKRRSRLQGMVTVYRIDNAVYHLRTEAPTSVFACVISVSKSVNTVACLCLG